METIKEVLMERDSMTAEAAEDLIAEAQAEFDSFIAEGNIEAYMLMKERKLDYLIELF